MTSGEVRDILPESNDGVVLVPQILTNKAGDFLEIAQRIAAYGYDTVNLNLGCPSGTVTAKKRGAGFLGEPEALDAFLTEIYDKCTLKISIRIPAIAAEQTQTCNGRNVCHDFDFMHERETLRAFHDEILDGYREIMAGDSPVLFKMKDLWTYMIMAFAAPDPSQQSTRPGRQTFEKYLKKIRKADRISEYLIAVDNLFREQC